MESMDSETPTHLDSNVGLKEMHGSVSTPKQHTKNVCILAESVPSWLAVADGWGADLL